MVAPVQPQPSGVVAQAAAAAALFKPGQVLEALVLGKTPDGLVALRIGEVVVNAQLPQLLPQLLPPGTMLQLQVKTGGPAPQLAMVGTPQLPAATVAPLTPPPTLPLPPVTVAPLQAPAAVVPRAPMASVPAPQASAMVPAPSASQVPVAPSPPAVLPAAPSVVAASPVPVVPATPGAPSIPLAAPQPAVAVAVPAPAIVESRQQVAAVATTIASTPAAAPAGGQQAPPPLPSVAAAPVAPTGQPAAPLPATSLAPAAALPQASVPVPVAPPAALASSIPALPVPLSAPVTGAPTTAASPVASPIAPPAATVATAAAPPQASPAVPPAPAVPSAVAPVPTPVAAAAPPEPAAPSPLLVAQGAVRPPATVADLPRAAPLPAAAPAVQPAPPPATPAAALAQMVPEALARQNSVAPLLAALATIVVKPGALPEPVLRAALQVLGQRVQLPPTGPTAPQLEAAIAKSGVYLEAALAKGTPAPDLKSGLVALKGALATWLGGNPAPVTAAQQAAPPLRGMPPRVQPIDPPLLPDAPRDAARALHGQADAALSRVKLMQFASLPDADPVRGATPELRTEVPFLLGQQLVMAQFQVTRDGAQRKAEGKRGWTMRFAMHLPSAGEVGAEIGLLGRSVNVALWVADADTSSRLEAALPELAPALAALGLEPGAVRVRALPPEAPRPASGQYLDSRR